MNVIKVNICKFTPVSSTGSLTTTILVLLVSSSLSVLFIVLLEITINNINIDHISFAFSSSDSLEQSSGSHKMAAL
jgi:hypothetical protein